MKYALAVLLVGLSSLAAGCGSNPAFSLRPLYLEKEKHPAEPRLEGEWTPVTLGSSGISRETSERWTVTAQKEGCYLGERRKKEEDKDQEERSIYQVCLVTLDGKMYFDHELREQNVGRQMIRVKDLTPNIATVHVVGRVWAQKDLLRFTRLNNEWIKKNQPEELRMSLASSLVFTGSTQQLRDIMARHGEDPGAMSSAWYLCRPAAADCGLQVVEDELAREPQDTSVLQGAARFYAGREEYDKTIALLSKRAELASAEAAAATKEYVDAARQEAASARSEVGAARLLKRDFSGARAEFAATAKPDTIDQLGNDFFTATSYFMEGKYPEAHRSLGRLPQAASAWAVMLDYAAQARMGRGKQAESFFADRMARFAGEDWEHLLLLRAAGRVRDFSPDRFTQDELDRGDGAFYAVVRLAKGDRQQTRQALEATVARVDKGSLVYVGAKIELERLDASEAKTERKQ